MVRVNICKECGAGPDLPEGVVWVGTNHNLCSTCVGARERRLYEARRDLESARSKRRQFPVAVAMAAAMFGGFR